MIADVAALLEQIGENANQIAGFLGVGGHQDLVLEQLHEVRGEGPGLLKLATEPIVFRRRRILEAEILGHMGLDQRCDLAFADLQAVFKEAMQQQVQPVVS